MTFAFFVLFSIFTPNLVRIAPIVTKWQQILEIQDGGVRHLEFWYICTFIVTVAFYVRFSTFPYNLKMIGPIVKKWQLIFACGCSCWISVAGNCSRSVIRAAWVSSISSAILISGSDWTRLDASLVWHCEQQRWLRSSQKLAKQHRHLLRCRWVL